MQLKQVALGCTLALAAFMHDEARAASITYTFSGAVTKSANVAFPLGMPFSGTLTIDTSPVGTWMWPIGTGFPQSELSSNLTLETNGLTLQPLGPRAILLQGGVGTTDFSAGFHSTQGYGDGWSLQTAPDWGEPYLSFRTTYAGFMSRDLNELPTFDVTGNPEVVLHLSAGVITYPDGEVTLTQGEFVTFGIDHLTLVPEPAAHVLGAFGLVACFCLVSCRRRVADRRSGANV